MIAIYDFDGTLTPYSLPQYQILKQCGYTDKKIMDRVTEEMVLNRGMDFYTAYFKCYKDILAENGISMTQDNVCLGAKDVRLNNGVEDYLKRMQSSKTGVKHYIVTSGIRDYVEETPISGLVDGIYGVTYKKEDGVFQDVDFLLSDKKKVDVIQALQKQNRGTKQVIYFGDGLTDGYAFEYVHSIGGKTVFVASSERAQTNYKKLNANGAIDEYFEADFGKDSKLSKFMQRQIELDKSEQCL